MDDLLDQALALALRTLERGDGPLPLVAARHRTGVHRRRGGAEQRQAVAQPAGVPGLDLREPPQGLRDLRIARPLGVLEKVRRLLRLRAVVLEQVAHQVPRDLPRAEQP